MNNPPVCPTCSSVLIDKFDGANVRWLCPQCDRHMLMFVKEEQNFWAGCLGAELIGFDWNKELDPSPKNLA